MVDLRPFRCVNPLCEGPRDLERAEDSVDLLRCASCGDTHAVKSYARAYGKRTSQWIVFAAVLLAVGWKLESTVEQVALSAGAVATLLAIYRVLRQVRLLRVLASDGR